VIRSLPRSLLSVVAIIFAFVLLIAPFGCTGGGGQMPPDIVHIKKLSLFYVRYLAMHKGVSPPDEAAFKAFIKKLSPAELSDNKIDTENLDPLFTSPRDNQTYGARYKVKSGMGDRSVILYEKTGKNGKRLVAYSTSDIEEVDEAKFNQLVPNP
jgi:hypothetical protein